MVIPGWDFILGIIFVIAIGYGLMLRHNQIRVVLLSTYVAGAVTTELGDTWVSWVQKFGKATAGDAWQSPSATIIRIALFAIVLVGLTLWGQINTKSGFGGMKSGLLTILFGFFSAGLLVSYIISFLPNSLQNDLYAASDLARKIMDFKIWWVVIPVIIMIASSIIAKRKKLPALEE